MYSQWQIDTNRVKLLGYAAILWFYLIFDILWRKKLLFECIFCCCFEYDIQPKVNKNPLASKIFYYYLQRVAEAVVLGMATGPGLCGAGDQNQNFQIR